MKPLRLLILVIFLTTIGCAPAEPTPPQPMPTLPPLTVEAWKTLPVEEKYDEGTFDRLREADPSLRNHRAWNKFMKEVVVPERMLDIPGIPGQPQD
jgi:hypothetical protein